MREGSRAPIYTAGEEIVHSLTHGLGLLLSIAGLVALVAAARLSGDIRYLVGCAVFGATLVLLYAASTLYHAVRNPPTKRILQRLDHGAIFLLIAGTFTPFALVSLRGDGGWLLLALIWGLALLGIAAQVVAPSFARRFSLPLYLAMGWLGLVPIKSLMDALQPEGLALLLVGGVAYSVGVGFYAWRRLPYNHAVWHLFVMAGSACHFSCVLGYVIPATG